MNWGLLWYDGSQTALEDKIGQAARRYREKHGAWPNTCYVHPGALDDHAGTDIKANGNGATIRVLTAPNILLHHLWLGVSND